MVRGSLALAETKMLRLNDDERFAKDVFLEAPMESFRDSRRIESSLSGARARARGATIVLSFESHDLGITRLVRRFFRVSELRVERRTYVRTRRRSKFCETPRRRDSANPERLSRARPRASCLSFAVTFRWRVRHFYFGLIPRDAFFTSVRRKNERNCVGYMNKVKY